MIHTVALTVFSATNCVAASPTEVIDLAPSTKWWLNYAENTCVVFRSFGEGENSIVIRLARSSPASGVSLTMVGKGLRSSEAVLELPFAFEDGSTNSSTHLLLVNTGKANEKPMLAWGSVRLDNVHGSGYPQGGNPPEVTPEREAAVSSLIFRAPNRTWYRLRTGSMKAIMAAIRSCTDKVIESWGYSPAVQHSLSRPATPTEQPSKWLGPFDYPKSMIVSGTMAIVEFRLDVADTGDVAGCKVISATLPEEASDTTCKLISQRAKFLPALDAAGKAAKSYYMGTVRWVIRR